MGLQTAPIGRKIVPAVAKLAKLELISMNIGANSTVFGGPFNVLRTENLNIVCMQEISANQKSFQDLVSGLGYSTVVNLDEGKKLRVTVL